MPIIIDKERRVVIIPKKFWQAIKEETNPEKKQLMLEALQMLTNPAVLTSYEKEGEDPRVIFFQEPKEKGLSEAETEEREKVEKKLEDQWGGVSHIFSFIKEIFGELILSPVRLRFTKTMEEVLN